MGRIYKTLLTDVDFFTAAISFSKVCVVSNSKEILEYSGHIEKYTPISVRINGVYYPRRTNLFKVEVKK